MSPLPPPIFDLVVFDSVVIGASVGISLALAEASSLGQVSPTAWVQARFFDTVLGCLVGLIGGICLHTPRFRDVVGRQMLRLKPSRLVA
jgi:uncharacterized membrane protein YccC